MNYITIQKGKTEKVITLLSASHILRNYPTTRRFSAGRICCANNFFFFVSGWCVFLFGFSSCADYSCIVCEVVAASSRAQRFKMTARKVLRLKFVSSVVHSFRRDDLVCGVRRSRLARIIIAHGIISSFQCGGVVGGHPLIGLYSRVINFSKLISISHQQAKLDSQQQRWHCSHNSNGALQCHRNQSSGESKFNRRASDDSRRCSQRMHDAISLTRSGKWIRNFWDEKSDPMRYWGFDWLFEWTVVLPRSTCIKSVKLEFAILEKSNGKLHDVARRDKDRGHSVTIENTNLRFDISHFPFCVATTTPHHSIWNSSVIVRAVLALVSYKRSRRCLEPNLLIFPITCPAHSHTTKWSNLRHQIVQNRQFYCWANKNPPSNHKSRFAVFILFVLY